MRYAGPWVFSVHHYISYWAFGLLCYRLCFVVVLLFFFWFSFIKKCIAYRHIWIWIRWTFNKRTPDRANTFVWSFVHTHNWNSFVELSEFEWRISVLWSKWSTVSQVRWFTSTLEQTLIWNRWAEVLDSSVTASPWGQQGNAKQWLRGATILCVALHRHKLSICSVVVVPFKVPGEAVSCN